MMKRSGRPPAGRKEEIVMRRTLVPLALAACLLASTAGAQLSQTFKDWPSGPAGFLMTDSDRKAYAQLKTDAEAQAFVDLFWAKRDPDLNTVQNEFKLDFDMRVMAADKQFSTEKLKGSMSDRGRVLIVMGRPVQPPYNVPAGTEEEEGTHPRFIEGGNSQIWVYTKDMKPPVKKSDEILFVFTESRQGAGDFILDRADRRNSQALKILAAKPEQLILNPKLTEVPRVGLLPGTKAATTSQQAVFDVQPRPWPEGATVLTATGVQSETVHPVWVYVQLPDSVPPAGQAVGRVRKAASDEVAGSFASPVVPTSVPGARAYEFSLPVAAGDWKVDVALLNEAGPVAITTADAKNEAAPADGPYISPFYWGADTRQAAQARMGDAFHVGGLHLIPRIDHHYKSEENLTYVAYIVRPSLDEQGQPKIELSVALYAIGKKPEERKKQDEQGFQPIQGAKIFGDIWVFGQILPLTSFRSATEFELDVSMKDSKTGLTRTGTIPFFVVREPAAAAPAAPPAPTAAPTAPPK
jgi:GWxTD domain-containing protein